MKFILVKDVVRGDIWLNAAQIVYVRLRDDIVELELASGTFNTFRTNTQTHAEIMDALEAA